MSEIRKRRADAERSGAAILDAATRVLGDEPNAGLASVAVAAGVSRQTVYAHYPTRERLIEAVVDHVSAQGLAAIDAVRLDDGPAIDAIVRLIEASWAVFARYPALLRMAPSSPQDSRHEPVLDRLDRVIRRGQRCGDIDPKMSRRWATTAIIALGHAAAAEVAAGRMSERAAVANLRTGVRRLLSA